jgi:hypothetical protein
MPDGTEPAALRA